jgi:hypothetical protein
MARSPAPASRPELSRVLRLFALARATRLPPLKFAPPLDQHGRDGHSEISPFIQQRR